MVVHKVVTVSITKASDKLSQGATTHMEMPRLSQGCHKVVTRWLQGCSIVTRSLLPPCTNTEVVTSLVTSLSQGREIWFITLSQGHEIPITTSTYRTKAALIYYVLHSYYDNIHAGLYLRGVGWGRGALPPLHHFHPP